MKPDSHTYQDGKTMRRDDLDLAISLVWSFLGTRFLLDTQVKSVARTWQAVCTVGAGEWSMLKWSFLESQTPHQSQEKRIHLVK